eukprot:11703117-Heterocapsa_arctica.AAC.1
MALKVSQRFLARFSSLARGSIVLRELSSSMKQHHSDFVLVNAHARLVGGDEVVTSDKTPK